MRIRATCAACRRELLLEQLLEGPAPSGRCPWCGEVLAPQNTPVLLDAVRRAEAAGRALESALATLRGGWARLRIDPASVLQPLRAVLEPSERTAGAAEPEPAMAGVAG
jgi:hypothetical protein